MDASLPVTEPVNALPVPKFSFVRKWGILVVLSLALAIIILDTTILNVALSTIIQDLNTDIQSLQWVITAYSLTLAALTITGGRMGDIFGRKRMFILGAILFAIGSFIASVSPDVTTLIIGESIIEGIGAALMMPATASLLVSNFAGRDRAIAFGVWGGIAGAAVALGPVLGGFLATEYSWRWGFRVNLIVVALLLLGSFLIPDKFEKKRLELDWFGVILSATGMLTFVYGIIESSRYGWWTAKENLVAFGREFILPGDLSVVPVFIAAGALILGVFMAWEFYREQRGYTPLVSPHIFSNRMFTAGVFTTAVMSLGQTGLIFALPVFLQSVRGLDAFHTGLALLPMSLGLLIVSPLSSILGRKIAPKILISLGLFLNAVAYVVLWFALDVTTTASGLMPGLLIYGIGMGFVMSQINNVTLSAVEVHEAGEASGINNTLRQVGSTLGSAVMGTILVGALATQIGVGIADSPVIPSDLKSSLADIVAEQSSNVEFGGGARLDSDLSPAIAEEITAISQRATVDASKQTLVYGAIFAFLGFLVAIIFLPLKVKDKDNSLPTPMKKDLDIFADIVTPERASLAPVAMAPLSLSVNAPVTVVPGVVAPKLTTAMIRDLIDVDAAQVALGQPGLGADIQTVLDLAAAQGSLTQHLDQRFVIGRQLFEAGVGKALGYTKFADYLRTLPPVPAHLAAPSTEFPYLVLVDSRLSPEAACNLLGLRVKGNESTPTLPLMKQTGGVYWLRTHNGTQYLGKSINEAKASFTPNEQAMSLIEGLMTLALQPSLITDRFIDLPATEHDGFPKSAACIGIWGGERQLRFRWTDHADPHCATLTRLA